ncbi:hypothetical protein [Pelomonas cellulosilytica]|uniref:GlsB/YeaQ/YmgE family stress response membrane protein n=1 Tax=Pelomonas cellulosilytica TaxID=2906762 RepID=A0ABS8XVK4_9BURK|nr:hypothetical protein [Pelomonas sp. P8]MCE4555938.1 hypothetical protein [Pelomonas sp. P8]
MNVIFWLFTGMLVAWLGSLGRDTMGRQRLLLDAIFAGVGAMLGGGLALSSEDWLGEQMHWAGIAGVAVGATLLLLIGNLRSLPAERTD